jgi:hypothetical protein
MSVVASYYAGPEQRPERGPAAPRARLILRSPPDPPRAAVGTRRKDIPLPLGYPIGLAYRRKLLVKVSLIIVNTGAGHGPRTAGQGRGPKFSRRTAICPATLRPPYGQARRKGAILTQPGESSAFRPGWPRSIEEDYRIFVWSTAGQAVGCKAPTLTLPRKQGRTGLGGPAGLPAHPAAIAPRPRRPRRELFSLVPG